MPWMPKYLKEEWAFLLNVRGRKQYSDFSDNPKKAVSKAFVLWSYNIPIIYRKGEVKIVTKVQHCKMHTASKALDQKIRCLFLSRCTHESR